MSRKERIGGMMFLPDYDSAVIDIVGINRIKCPGCGLHTVSGRFTDGTDVTIKCARCRTMYHVGSGNGKSVKHDYRCPYCKKLVFKGSVGLGSIVVVLCPRKRCKRETHIKY